MSGGGALRAGATMAVPLVPGEARLDRGQMKTR
jgi:hypothetical protein